MHTRPSSQKALSRPARILLIVAGTLAVVLAMIGVLVPVLPTTVFLLLAAAAYARSSDRFYTWLVTNRVFGAYIRNYREGRGISLRHKLLTMLLLWATIGVSGHYFVDTWWVKLILLAVAIGVSIHIITIRTAVEPVTQPVKTLAVEPDYEET